jgi:Tfp pilus assembly protein PilX
MTPFMHAPAHARGAVLVVSLVLLVVLTLLGVSVMNMTRLEERMASNSQELMQAFQSAETGLSQAYANSAVWNPAVPTDVADTDIPTELPAGIARNGTSSYQVEFLTATGPPPGYDVAQFQTANFDFRSEGKAQSGFSSVLHGGGFRVFRAAGFLP